MSKKELKAKEIKKNSVKELNRLIIIFFVLLTFAILIVLGASIMEELHTENKDIKTYHVETQKTEALKLAGNLTEKYTSSLLVENSEEDFYIVSFTNDALTIINNENYKEFKNNDIIKPSFYTSLFGKGYVINKTLSLGKYTCDVEICDNTKLNITKDNNPWFEKTVYNDLKNDNQIYSLLKNQIINSNNPVLVYIKDKKENVIGVPVIGAVSRKAAILYSDKDFLTININEENQEVELTTLYEYCKNVLGTEKTGLIDKNKNSCSYTYEYQYKLK